MLKYITKKTDSFVSIKYEFLSLKMSKKKRFFEVSKAGFHLKSVYIHRMSESSTSSRNGVTVLKLKIMT